MLQEWLDRTGPYAGDFLIPEPIRKKIFRTSLRSGLATRADLRPEFQSQDFPLYDAETSIAISADGFSFTETGADLVLDRQMDVNVVAGISIEFSNLRPDAVEVIGSSILAPTGATQESRTIPHVRLEGYKAITEFVQTVPALTDSCIVQDYGIPRACPGRYYWIWAWDALVSMMEGLRWGDLSHASDTVRFIDQHRDELGRIPARWTRSLEPLDTPTPGGIEFLHIALIYETFLESGDRRLLLESLPSFRRIVGIVGEQLERNGLAYGEGFYPDLLAPLGRNRQSAVSMEVGSLYAFCRILENMSRLLGESDLAQKARESADTVSKQFSGHFWDKEDGFFVDAIDPVSGAGNRLHPAFALLFLQSPLGMPLVRPHLQEAASFIRRELVTDAGFRTMPLREAGPNGEVVLDAWYPHWDLYALKILRRAGAATSLMRWLKHVEETLTRLGYCPEFLSLRGFRENDPHAWEHHGSASNLNCVTSWLRGIRESIIGFEFDPGGITHIPLSLPIGNARIEGVRWRGGNWSFQCDNGGSFLDCLTVDEVEIAGTAKVPSGFHTPGEHLVQAHYSNRSPLPCIMEIINANVNQSARRNGAIEVEIDPLGFVEVAFFSPETPRLLVQGNEVVTRWDSKTGRGFVGFSCPGPCVLTLGKG
jgi:hypothetical protein